jgi:P450-derived glycosyltransferase activator
MLVADGLGRRLQLVQAIVWAHSAHGDPYATLLRGFDEDVGPIHELVRARGSVWRSAIGTWVTADHRLGTELLSHPGFGSRCADGRPVGQPEQVMPMSEAFLDIDRAEADRLRGVWDPVWRGEAGQWYRASTRRVCARVLDGVADQFADEFDMVAELAERVPVEVLAELFALCDCQRARLRVGCAATAIALDSVLCPQRLAPTYRMLAAIDDLRTLFGELTESGDGLLTRLGDRPARDDVRAWGVLLAVVGVRMAANLVTNALPGLLARPELWSALANAPRLASRVVAETLRYDPPVQVAVRVAHTEVELAGQLIPAGHQVAVLLGAANRDPAVFPDPKRYDPDRTIQPAAGPLLPGPPHEVVLPFATTQAEILLRELAIWWPRLRTSGTVLRRDRAPVTRSLLRFPVTPN